MKKTYIILSILVIGSLTACKKEYSSSDVFKDLSIKATVTNLDTKTTYNKSGSTYEFSWVQNDVISVMLIDGASNRDRFNYTTTEATPGASAVFNPAAALDAKWSLAEYAFYPANTNGFTYPNKTASPTLTLGENINLANDSNPYAAIPMIGVNNGDGTFSFKAGTGVLKVSFTNLPAGVSGHDLHLELKTASTYLTGACTFPIDDKMLSISSSGGRVKKVNYTSVADASAVSFFVPIPACTIPAKDLTFVLRCSTLPTTFSSGVYFFDNFVNPQAITIERGVVSELPAIDVTSITNCLSFTGTSTAPKVTLIKGARVSKVRYSVATTIAAGIDNLKNTPAAVVELDTNGETPVANPASSGDYYIVYTVMSPEGKIINYNYLQFTYEQP